ncbi:signal peptidase I [bacterium]|nr:signal peptidase I [bacterium]
MEDAQKAVALNQELAINSSEQNISPSEVGANSKSRKKEKSTTYELFQILIYALLFAYIVRTFFIQGFKIPTGSMEDTLLVGDFLLVNKFIYGATTPETLPLTDIEIPQWRLPAIRDPKPGDVIVFKFPPDPTVDYIKRCVGVAGQTVEIRDKAVLVDGHPFSEVIQPEGLKFEDPEIIPRNKGYESMYPKDAGSRDNYGPVTIPDGYVFVLGDNRDRSYDSRQWGFVPRENIIGKALFVFWSNASDNNLDVRWDRIGKMIN